jgi:hypothetical protein
MLYRQGEWRNRELNRGQADDRSDVEVLRKRFCAIEKPPPGFAVKRLQLLAVKPRRGLLHCVRASPPIPRTLVLCGKIYYPVIPILYFLANNISFNFVDMNPRVLDVKYQEHYKLILTFANKEVKEFDLSSYLDYPIYRVLQDESFCRKARAFNATVIWNDEVDFDPDTLYLESKPVNAA